MNTLVAPDKHNRIVLTRDIRKAAGLEPGEPMKRSVSPGRIVLEVTPETRGRIVKQAGIKVWTGKVPSLPVEAAVEQARHYPR